MNKLVELLIEFKKYTFPDRCVGCYSYPGLLCKDCILKFEVSKSICHVCKTPSDEFRTHDNCKKKSVIEQGFICYKYSKTIEKCVVKLKFNFVEEMAGIIAGLMWDSGNVPVNLTEYLIVPIPLHRKRENLRGFNQSELIALRLMDSARHPQEKIPPAQPPQDQSVLRGSLKVRKQSLVVKLLKRVKEKKPQLGKNKAERISGNLGIYQVDSRVVTKLGAVKNPKILLVDDICTTGATLESAGREIKKYWPHASISSLVFARG